MPPSRTVAPYSPPRTPPGTEAVVGQEEHPPPFIRDTNAIESLNARFRRAVRHRGHFPNEQAALKVLYLVATQKRKNRENMTGKTNGWKNILNTLTVHYGDRIAAAGIN